MTLLSSVAPVDETPLESYLAEQADLTAVERFAQRHEEELVPAQARYYRDLIPLTTPQPGQQYGFEVDLDACTGCKACVAACHSLNGLDEGESWRSVTLLTGGTPARPVQQVVTSACHHCVEPACLQGCPVDAYEKDPITGVVSHLDDQCIGCSYCTLSCPYEVPLYNHERGIVRKCDMCRDRLADGEAPACVQSCPNGAIAVKVVDTAAVVARAPGSTLVPGLTPPSSITVPTTVYRSHRRAQAANDVAHRTDAPARAHPPLAVMLVLTQLSVGAFIADLVLRLLTDRGAGWSAAFDVVVAAAAGVLALGASVLHLGRPGYCYRAIIGLRHSWLSREVLAFGAFTGLSLPYVLLLARGDSGGEGTAVWAVGAAVAMCGLAGVACSVLIYTTTRRASWTPVSVTAKFGLTVVVCGLATVLWESQVLELIGGSARLGQPSGAIERGLLVLLAVVMTVKLAGEASVFRHLVRGDDSDEPRRARLLVRDLRPTTVRRYALGLFAGVALPLVLGVTDAANQWPVLGLVATTAVVTGVVVAELCERSLFFLASAAPRERT